MGSLDVVGEPRPVLAALQDGWERVNLDTGAGITVFALD